MTHQLHDPGEEAILDNFFEESLSKPSSLDVGLYNDSTDDLADDDDIGAITTEPSGASYARQPVLFGSSGFTTEDTPSGDWQAILSDTVFDTSDSSQVVDSYFVVINFSSDNAGDSSSTDHLLFSGPLDKEYPLNDLDDYTLSGMGIKLT